MMRLIFYLATIMVATASPAIGDSVDRQLLADAAELPVFVTAKEKQEAFLSNLGRGRLVVDESGCLRHGGSFVIWTYGSRLRTKDNRIQVIDGVTGKAVLVGQEIGMSGVDSSAIPDPDRLAVSIPSQCGGPYKWGGPIMTEVDLQKLDERWRKRLPVPLPMQVERKSRQ